MCLLEWLTFLQLVFWPLGQINGTYSVKTPPLTTNWTYEVGTNPWPEYPRPQLQRFECRFDKISSWSSSLHGQNLNGIWRYENASGLTATQNPPFGQKLQHEVLVPSCLESALSGIMGNGLFYSWLSTSFTIPSSWSDKHVLLNFGSVDYEATVYVNGHKAGFNRGGYHKFTLDVTSLTKFDGDNELLVFVHDPTDSGDYVIPIGKQTLRPSHIFYTPCSGIWQSVWIEPAPANYITRLDVDADMNGQVNMTVHTSCGTSTSVEVTIYETGSEKSIATHNGTSDYPFQFKVPSPSIWSPDSPTLYNMSITLGSDTVRSYTGFRTISKEIVNGVVRPLLNGEPIFMFGTLDQGYWPDGIYTPPNREAMVYDLQVLRSLGFNMLRKHAKVENDLFYQACDQMGLLLIQDMPSLRPLHGYITASDPSTKYLPDGCQQAEFTRQLEILVNQHKSYPSIAVWVIYNEGWGQVIEGYPEFGLTELVRSLDPTRLVDSTSGWYDHGAGDFSDNHHYANPQCGTPFYSTASSPYDPTRIAIQGEFGGIGQNLSLAHLWNVQEAINTINQTYEIVETGEAWNYRAHVLLQELRSQVEMWACSAGVWTQTTDVEGEVNGLFSYDRRVLRADVGAWRADIQALYAAMKRRTSNSTMKMIAQGPGVH